MQNTVQIQRLEARQKGLRKAGLATLFACFVFSVFTIQYLKLTIDMPGVHVPSSVVVSLQDYPQLARSPDLGAIGTLKLVTFAISKIVYLLLLPALVIAAVRRRWLLCLSVVAAFHTIVFFSDTFTASANRPALFVPADVALEILESPSVNLTPPDEAYIRRQLGGAVQASGLRAAEQKDMSDALRIQRMYQLTGDQDLVAGCSMSHCWNHSVRRRALTASIGCLVIATLSGAALVLVSLLQRRRLDAIVRLKRASMVR